MKDIATFLLTVLLILSIGQIGRQSRKYKIANKASIAKLDSLNKEIHHRDSIDRFNRILFNSLHYKSDLTMEEAKTMDSLLFITQDECDYQRIKERILGVCRN